MRLFFINEDSDPSFNRDLFVMADTPEQAVASWRRHFEEEGNANPQQVFDVIPSKRKGALDWNGPNCRRVLGKPHP